METITEEELRKVDDAYIDPLSALADRPTRRWMRETIAKYKDNEISRYASFEARADYLIGVAGIVSTFLISVKYTYKYEKILAICALLSSVICVLFCVLCVRPRPVPGPNSRAVWIRYAMGEEADEDIPEMEDRWLIYSSRMDWDETLGWQCANDARAEHLSRAYYSFLSAIMFSIICFVLSALH